MHLHYTEYLARFAVDRKQHMSSCQVEQMVKFILVATEGLQLKLKIFT